MRACGILMPVFSLSSDYGIGCFDEKAYEFVDKLYLAGQKYWQVLPMGPTGYGDSPYQAFSTFAGNPYYISLKELVRKGYITKEDIANSGLVSVANKIDYENLYKKRFPLLKKAYKKSNIGQDKDFRKFLEDNKLWIGDYAEYMAIKDSYEGAPFYDWSQGLRFREEAALEEFRKGHESEIEFYEFLQYEFYIQWMKLKKYANDRKIKIIGDIPIYVSADSADVWSGPELFMLGEDLKPLKVAGCPPDAFSKTGQLWGNPVYDWEYHKNTDYEWWIRRMEACFKLYDMVRIDHFRGFDEFYAIPYGNDTAVDGQWLKGPGKSLFKAFDKKLGKLNIIAEDLGYLTDSVRKLLKKTGFPGMKVLQFAFDSREESDYLVHNYSSNSVVYTGTHDNQTTAAFWDELTPEDHAFAMEYMNIKSRRFVSKRKMTGEKTYALIKMALMSVSKIAIIPLQDYLCLGAEARINTPSTLGNNWCWRMSDGALGDELCAGIKNMCRTYGRIKR